MWKSKVSTRAGLNKFNEDRHQVNENKDRSIFVLADGMGGRSYGDLAAEIAVETICSSDWELTDIEQSFLTAFEKADDAIAQKSEELHCKMGCAVGCLVITDDELYYVGLGDIRLYAKDKECKLLLLSTDNVICGKNGQTFLTRSLRGRGLRKPLNILQYPIGTFCSFSLCSDGYYKNDADDDAINIDIQHHK